jgi:hypothetical protein
MGPIDAKGAVTVDFGLPGKIPLDRVIPAIERDRMIMAARPGFRQKHLPIRPDPDTGNVLSGGRYLFNTVEDAEQYRSWAQNDFIVDGVKFFERPSFIDPVAYVWTVVGAQNWADYSSHAVIRSERWRYVHGLDHGLEQTWPRICKEAEARGLASVWLLHNEAEHLAGLVSIARHTEPGHADDTSVRALETSPSLGTLFEEPRCVKVFDRTSLVLTIWFPVAEGSSDVPALWPNSPPMPAPVYTMTAT